MPYFSIVIPVFNRERLVGRAIDSCLRQTYTDFEVVVVDDASTDNSVSVVRRYTNSRVKLIQHARNRGVCPARNTGVGSASGHWIVFLDSDDELLPYALEIIYRRSQQVDSDTGRMVFMYRLDDGQLSPQPSLTEGIWDYAGYLRWFDGVKTNSDFSNCVRKSTFAAVRQPEDRSVEGLYHLDFARQFKTHTFPDVVALIHSDAENRSVVPQAHSLLLAALDNARSLDRLLQSHQAGLYEHCPNQYRVVLRTCALQYFLAGQRVAGWRRTTKLIALDRLQFGAWALFLLGCLSRQTVANIIVRRWRSRAQHVNAGLMRRIGLRLLPFITASRCSGPAVKATVEH